MADISAGYFIIVGIFAFVFGYLTMDVLVKAARQFDFSKFCILFGSMAVIIPAMFWFF